MVVLFLRFDQHIININFDVLAYLIVEHPIHEPLIGCSSVFLSKWHHLVVEESSTNDERRLFFICLIYHYLVVT